MSHLSQITNVVYVVGHMYMCMATLFGVRELVPDFVKHNETLTFVTQGAKAITFSTCTMHII